jgi:predicted O-linked N-acetylglucosamine transferase (SPINDLY family)
MPCGLVSHEALAVRLAQDRGELQTIRQRLAKNRLTEPLFDTPRFVRNLEKAYKQMYEIFVAGERPKQIEIGET